MKTSNYITGADAFGNWRENVLAGTPSTLYPIGTGALADIEIGPNLVTLLGGGPGAGKTAFVMQSAIEAMRFTPTLRVCICNIEMPASVLLDRQLARIAGIDSRVIRKRQLDEKHADRMDRAMVTIESVIDRLCFVRPPFDLENVAATVDAFGAGLLVLDYIQRIKPPGNIEPGRGSVNATMNFIRQFADAGMAVVVLSAVGRTKDAKGRSSYSGDGLSLASFRESSELEFGADDAFILAAEDEDPIDSIVRLKHLKSRNGECKDILLRFEKRYQRLTPIASTDEATANAVSALWDAAEEAGDEE